MRVSLILLSLAISSSAFAGFNSYLKEKRKLTTAICNVVAINTGAVDSTVALDKAKCIDSEISVLKQEIWMIRDNLYYVTADILGLSSNGQDLSTKCTFMMSETGRFKKFYDFNMAPKCDAHIFQY